MFSMFKHAAAAIALVISLLFSILPAMSYEMDYFPKFNAKQHFYVQPGSVPKNMDAAFFAEMEQRLVSIAEKDQVNIYFVCASSDEADANTISASALNFVQVLWMEWAHQGMPTSKTAIVVLASNRAENPTSSKFRASAWYDNVGIPISYLNSSDAESTFASSSALCLEERNCPHQFVRAVTLHLQDGCAALSAKQKAEVQKKQEAETARKMAEAVAAETGKIQAARASDHGKGSTQITAVRDAIQKLQSESTRVVASANSAFYDASLVVLVALIAGCALYIWSKPKSRT